MRSLASLLPLALLLLAAPLVAARYNGDLLAPFDISARDNMDAVLSYSPSNTSPLSASLLLTGADGECCDCVHGVAQHILESALKAVADACSNVTCPVIKQRCDWIAAHQAEYSGVLAVELRPFTDGYMYCYGKGSCKHPGVSSELFQLDSTANVSIAYSQSAVAVSFLEDALQMETNSSQWSTEGRIGSEEMASNDRFGRRRRMGPGDASTIARTKPSDADESGEDKKRSCHSCLRHGVRWVLKRSIHQLKSACESTKCPHFQAFCKWAEQHKEVVRGMLYAHVQPWKAASGYCAGKGSCHCGSRDNGTTDEETPSNAPFTMGEHQDGAEEKQVDVQPAKVPVIGGGDHDKVAHRKIILE